MQDRYAGDVGDFGKFGMLRALAAEGFSVGVNWYKFETPASELTLNDGMKLIPHSLVACDPALAYALRAIATSPARCVAALEKADLIPGTTYYSKVVPVKERTAWHEAALAQLATPDLVFLDPDNGLLVKSVGKRSVKSPKYTFYEEVADYVARGKSVVVYNHRCRKKPAVYFGQIYDALRAAVPGARGISAITFRRGSVRDYFAISASAKHEARIVAAFAGMCAGAWGHAGMCRSQPLPYVEG